jgi:hypothetical protein
MENEIRYYLRQIKAAMAALAEDEQRKAFKPQYLVTAVKLPTGAIELAVNTQNIADKIDYILEAYDDDMQLKTNTSIKMKNILII